MDVGLNEIFEGSQNALDEMEKVFKEHEKIETVIVNPDSWTGKTLLVQAKRLIDLRGDVNSLTASINQLHRKIDHLLNSK